MIASATDGGHLEALGRMAVPVLQAAQTPQPPRRGAKRWYTDWQIAAMGLIGVLARRQTKSAQYRYLRQRRRDVVLLLGLVRWPSRSTYF